MSSSFKLKKDYNFNVPSWDSILYNYNQALITGRPIKHTCPGFFVSPDAHEIDKVKPVMQDLKCKVAHLYFNVCIGPTFGRHVDDVEVYFWQCHGIIHWIIENERIILSPGDLLIIKKGIYHEVIPQTPRAGISMSKS